MEHKGLFVGGVNSDKSIKFESHKEKDSTRVKNIIGFGKMGTGMSYHFTDLSQVNHKLVNKG
ncbi:hypothetical protein NSQ59_27760 [Margalitia sp. FSL K6-0131]|uniref:hypothetical protein n=1 Tax=Margalitia sp. FSL K6-0131 TaxID=2954604 RepID=UPI0030F561CC